MRPMGCLDNVRWFLFAFYLCYLFESSGFSYTIGTARAVQVQLKRGSLSSGFLIAARDAGFVASVLLLSLFGTRGNRAVWLGLACSLGAVGNILIGLPSAHFFYRQSQLESVTNTSSSDEDVCVDSQHLMWTMLAGHGMFGFGHSTVWSLGVPLLDAMAQRLKNPLPLAIAFSMRIIGPVCGFLLSAVFNMVKLWKNESWWLGYIILGLLQLLPSIWLIAFRKRATDSRQFDACDTHNVKSTEGRKRSNTMTKVWYHVVNNFKTSFFAVKLVMSSNPVYVGSLTGRTIDAFAFKGAFVFAPLFMNIEFEQSSVATSLYFGTLGMIAFTGGIILGGVLVSKLDYDGHKVAAFIGLSSLFCGVITICQIWIPCDNLINRVGSNFNETNCFGEICPPILNPVCDSSTGESFASLCHAGCRQGNSDCACTLSGAASSEYCDSTSCLVASLIYMSCIVVVGIATGSAVIPTILVLLCAVPPQRRSVALGFSGLAVILFGTLPSSLVFGYLIDSSCVMWSEQQCSGRGYCVSYDSLALRLKFHLTCGILRICAMFTDFYVRRHAIGLRLTAETFEEPQVSLGALPVTQTANLHLRHGGPSTIDVAENSNMLEINSAHRRLRMFYEERPLSVTVHRSISAVTEANNEEDSSSMISASASTDGSIETVSIV